MNSMDSIIPTSVIGSYAWPSWLSCGIDAARRGAFGPTDLAEMLEDAVDTALRDQEEAGVDIVTDGEMRRSGFFTAEFYSHLTGVRAQCEPAPQVGSSGARSAAPVRGAGTDLGPARIGRGAGVSLCARAHEAPAESDSARAIHAVWTSDRRDGLSHPLGCCLGLRAHRQRRVAPVGRGRRAVHSDRRSLTGDPSRHAPVSFPHSSMRRSRASRYGWAPICASAITPASPLARRNYEPVLNEMLALRVDELALEYANRELTELPLLSDDRGAAGCGGGSHRREELLYRDAGRCGRAHPARAAVCAGGTAYRGAGLWVQPDATRSSTRQTARHGGRNSPGATRTWS